MIIIRENDGDIMNMLPLLMDWGIKRCNVEGCSRKPNTIIAYNGNHFGLCENHYQMAAQLGGMEFVLVFDDYDAFGG